MPMVTESSIPPPRDFKVSRGTSGITTFSLPNGRHRWQYGYRSGAMSEEEKSALADTDLTWAGTRSYIDLMDRDEFYRPTVVSQRKSRAWMVNDRDYVETRYTPHGFNGVIDVFRPPNRTVLTYRRSFTGAFGVSSIASGAFPSWPANVSGIAGDLLRESRPSPNTFNLARFTLEGRDAPLMFKAASYIPRSRAELGGAYLNWLFGVKPTASDLSAAADLVLRTERHISSYLEREKVVEKSSRSRTIWSESLSGIELLQSYGDTSTGGITLTGKHNTKYVYLTHSGKAALSDNVCWPVLSWSYTAKTFVRTFATWEYFVPRPHEIDTRLKRYRKNAELLLGSAKVDASTVYELTPWSWLADWFVDIGGLLRYQQAVYDHGLVSSGCGYSIFDQYYGTTSYTECWFDSRMYTSPSTYPINVVVQQPKVFATVSYKKQNRRSGSPYSVSPTWELNPKQWAILGALGLARSSGVPMNRS